MNVFIFSLEGEKSNTEINFFKGLSHHTDPVVIFPFEIGMQGNKSTDKTRIEGKIKNALRKEPDISYADSFVFFIGDGDKETQIKPMERAMNTIIEYLITFEFKEQNIHKKLIYDKTLTFEGVLAKIQSKNYLPSNLKKISNIYLFNMYANEFCWYGDDNLIEKQKIIDDFNSIHSKYLIIIEKVLS